MRFTNKILYLLAICFFCSCNSNISNSIKQDALPNIFPDYKFVTIPINIAPLNFKLQDKCDKIQVQFKLNNEIILTCNGKQAITIPLKKWKELLTKAADNKLQVEVFQKNEGKWQAYLPFDINVSSDSIDNYIAYRLIDPGYERWTEMGLFQRNLSTFEESVIIPNKLTDNGCVNCHSFSNYNPNRFMFHSRGEKFGGTFLFADGKKQRVNTKTEHASSAGTYPMWHPSGNYIAFSVNTTRQAFHALPGKKIEVYDLASDLAIFDVVHNTMLRDTLFSTKDQWETFPAWSPDGKWLYYCYADAHNMPFESEKLKYGICRVGFDETTGLFTQHIDTIINQTTNRKSASFPRISPDGKYLLYTQSDYATFPIWHKEADLKMIDLTNNSAINISDINSPEADSYHSWSSNGRWIMFSSRRLDGLYTRLFFAYMDKSGKVHKPFALPQKHADFYDMFFKSYNVPEFAKGKIELSPYEMSHVLEGETTSLTEKPGN